MNTAPSKLSTQQISAAAADWVARRAAGLSPEEERGLSRWLAADPRHQSAFDHYAKAFAAFDRPCATEQVGRFVQEVETLVRRKRRRRTRAMLVGVASVLLFAVVWRSNWQSASPDFVRENAVVHKPETRTLPDGSLVELKAGAELIVSFSDTSRRVELRTGGAHFRVVTDASRPFVVSAHGVDTRAVGTAFSVQLERQEVEVIVTHGRVAVERSEMKSPASSTDSAPLALVDAGRRLVLNLANDADLPAIAVLPPEELAERLSWRSPRLEFTDTPLAEAIALMNREADALAAPPGHRLRIDESSRGLAEEPVTGFFRADKTEAFVRMIEITLGAQSERRDGEIVLYRKR